MGFPGGLSGKEPACNGGNLGSIPRLGRSPGEGKGCPLQYSGLENSMDCIVYRVTKSRAQLSFHYYSGSFCEAVSQGCSSIWRLDCQAHSHECWRGYLPCDLLHKEPQYFASFWAGASSVLCHLDLCIGPLTAWQLASSEQTSKRNI